MSNSVRVFDTTLRDGAQMSGVSFSVFDKIAIAKRLDELGFHYIEGGFPGSNAKDKEFFDLVRKEKWGHAKVCAFGPTHHKKFTPATDPALQAILASEVKVAVLFGKSSRFHAEAILEVTAERNLEIIHDSIEFLTERGLEVIFDAEHFFDGFIEDQKYAISCLAAAEQGGAINLTLADTNGGMLPEQIETAIAAVSQKIKAPLGIHTHNDGDLAVANSLMAIRSGAVLVQGTINGFGERCGNANLCSIIPNLQLKMGIKVISDEALKRLTETARFVQELGNVIPREDLPYVGRWAFRHKGGVHVAAMRKHPKSYEHIDPALVGNMTSSTVSELSGKANIMEFLEKSNISANEQQVKQLLDQVKELEQRGLSYEGAEASLEIIARQLIENKAVPFHLKHYFVHSEKNIRPAESVEATIQVDVDGQQLHTAGMGNGPVNALDAAMRKALEPHFPQLKQVELIDFKVRILDMAHGTSAQTRVQIESKSSSGEIWRTMGCSQNIIEASMTALFDSYVYAIWKL